MNALAKNLMIRVIKKRIEDEKQSFDTIIKDYPKLEEGEIAELRASFSE